MLQFPIISVSIWNTFSNVELNLVNNGNYKCTVIHHTVTKASNKQKRDTYTEKAQGGCR